MSAAAISLTVLALVVVLFVWNQWPVELVAIGSALVLYGAGVIGLDGHPPARARSRRSCWSARWTRRGRSCC